MFNNDDWKPEDPNKTMQKRHVMVLLIMGTWVYANTVLALAAAHIH